jgi:Spy/CpxP family protein refolding chaperone
VSEPVRPLSRARALSAALLIAVFLAGGLVGAAADRALSPDRHHGHGRHGFEAEVFDRLKLDPRQKAAVETIMERRRTEAGKVWSEVRPRLNEIVAATRDDLSRVLSPGQLAEYDRVMAERLRRMESRYETGKSGG